MFGLSGVLRLVLLRKRILCTSNGLQLVHVRYELTSSPYVGRPVFSGMTSFSLDNLAPSDFVRRVTIQDLFLAPYAPYRVTHPNKMIQCNGPNCVGFRIHDNIEYTVVPSSNWSAKDVVPYYSSTWKPQFDPAHDWDAFAVENASTIQIEFSGLESTENFTFSTDCRLYGFPILLCKFVSSKETPLTISSLVDSI